MKKKYLAVASFTALLSFTLAHPVFAGEWKQDAKGWWYQNTNGTYPTNTWRWVDSDNDGTCECYYFDANGYCLMNTTTPDGYQVDSKGAWVENGAVKQQAISYDVNINTSNTIDYSRYSRNDIIDRNLTVSYLGIYESNGTPISCSYRPQTVFDIYNGCSLDTSGSVKLERGKEYYLEAIITAYSRGDLPLNYPRAAVAYATNGAGVNETEYTYDLDINPLIVTNSVNQSRLTDKQVVEGSVSGNVLGQGEKRQATFGGLNYTYTGICFKSNTFKITDKMPDKGHIEVAPTLYINYFDSNENIFDDDLHIEYVIAGSNGSNTDGGSTQLATNQTDYNKLSQNYDDRGINLTVLDMLNSTKEENAAKYTVVKSTSEDSYDADFPGIIEDIIYSNDVGISYDTKNRAHTAYMFSTSNEAQRSLYKYVPKDSDFSSKSSGSLERKLNQYAESLGFTYDPYGHITTDGKKTYNTVPEYGMVTFSFNNEDGICMNIMGLGKTTNYNISISKLYR